MMAELIINGAVCLTNVVNQSNGYVEGFDIDGNPISIRAREELAIVFQHEIDHLNGILFIDRIDPKNPFKGKDTYRAI